MLNMNKSLRDELKSLRSYLNHIENRNAQSVLMYDRVRDRHERQLGIMHERLLAKSHLVKSFYEFRSKKFPPLANFALQSLV